MSWVYVRIAKRSARILARSALTAVTLVLAFLLQAFAAGALVETGPVGPPAVCLSANPTTAALADGDDTRARFLANLCGDATRAADPDR